MRVGGRLENTTLNYNTKHLIAGKIKIHEYDHKKKQESHHHPQTNYVLYF